MTVYMEVTKDKYEFPLHIEDSPQKLAAICGVSASSVSSSCCLYRKGIYKRARFVSVEIEEDE